MIKHQSARLYADHEPRLEPGTPVRVVAGDYEGSVGTVLWCGREQVVVEIMGAELAFTHGQVEVL